jgi:hypothetical protein
MDLMALIGAVACSLTLLGADNTTVKQKFALTAGILFCILVIVVLVRQPTEVVGKKSLVIDSIKLEETTKVVFSNQVNVEKVITKRPWMLLQTYTTYNIKGPVLEERK